MSKQSSLLTSALHVAKLDKRLRELIAADQGVTPDEVTSEFIDQRTAELWSKPEFRFDDSGDHGGYEIDGLEVQNQYEIEAEREKAESILGRFFLRKR